LTRKEREEKYIEIERLAANAIKDEDKFDLINQGLNLAKQYEDKDFVLFFLSEESGYKKDYDKQENYLKQAIEINPNYFFYRCLGVFLSCKNNETEAIKYYDKAIELNPNDYHSYRQKGVSLSKLGNPTEAIKYFDKAINLNPNDYHSYRDKGVSLSKLGNETEAIKYYDKAIELNHNDYHSYREKGVSLSKLGNPTEAIKYYDKAIELSPNDYLSYGWKGDNLKRLGKYEDAEPYLEKSLKQNVFKPQFMACYAEVLFKLKKFNEAKIYIEEAEKLDTEKKYEYIIRVIKSMINEDSDALKFFEEQEKKLKAQKEKFELYQKFSDRMSHKIGNQYFVLNNIVKLIDLKGCESFDEDKLDTLKDAISNISSILKELDQLKAPLSKSKLKVDVKKELLSLKNIKQNIQIEIETDLGIILLEKYHFMQAMTELIQNSTKNNGENVKIKIIASITQKSPKPLSDNKNWLLVKVIDEGKGIPFSKKDTIFEPFFSMNNGSGLGLSIVKKTIEEEHEGIIRETGKEGVGACFEIFIPIEEKKDES